MPKKSGWRWVWVGIFILLITAVGATLICNVEKVELDQTSKEEAPGEFLLLPAGEVHYQLVGPADGPLVALVHGFSVPSYVWDPTLSALESAGYRVLIFDLYGRGYSDRIDEEYDIDLFTTQLTDLLIGLKIDQPIVVGGLSMGGPIAARFAHQHPQQTAGVILIAPEVIQTSSGDIFPMNVPLIGEYMMRTIMEPFLLPKLQAADFHHPERYPDWEDRYRIQLKYQGTGKALLSTIRNLTENDPEEEYRSLEETGIPVLLIWGEEDQTIGWEQVEALGKLLPELQVETVRDTGHLPHYEKAEFVNPLIISFLEACSIKD